ncbi:hypothetical protein E4U54_007840 [Claviceps lovelessii]|nr:hypothetical protein E4U54_007840 [Claviceps lovelessii]
MKGSTITILSAFAGNALAITDYSLPCKTGLWSGTGDQHDKLNGFKDLFTRICLTVAKCKQVVPPDHLGPQDDWAWGFCNTCPDKLDVNIFGDCKLDATWHN